MGLANEVLLDYVRYTRWATSALLDSCAALTHEELHHDMHTAFPTVWVTLVHIYQADSMWRSRFQQNHVDALAAFDPGLDIDELRDRWASLLDSVVAFAAGLTEAQWQAPLRYRNTRGESFEQPLWQALMHMVNHATLHRGQILAMFRQLDRVPSSVDLMNYYRCLPSGRG